MTTTTNSFTLTNLGASNPEKDYLQLYSDSSVFIGMFNQELIAAGKYALKEGKIMGNLEFSFIPENPKVEDIGGIEVETPYHFMGNVFEDGIKIELVETDIVIEGAKV